ncbi:hypothetical protein ACFLRA_00570 [Bdellovibrionota bacterium]
MRYFLRFLLCGVIAIIFLFPQSSFAAQEKAYCFMQLWENISGTMLTSEIWKESFEFPLNIDRNAGGGNGKKDIIFNNKKFSITLYVQTPYPPNPKVPYSGLQLQLDGHQLGGGRAIIRDLMGSKWTIRAGFLVTERKEGYEATCSNYQH